VEFLTDGDRWFRDKKSGEVVNSADDYQPPDPIEPDNTVGTTTEPDFESAPDVRTRSVSESDDSESFVGRLLRRLFGR
jgi:hypothetical protein